MKCSAVQGSTLLEVYCAGPKVSKKDKKKGLNKGKSLKKGLKKGKKY